MNANFVNFVFAFTLGISSVFISNLTSNDRFSFSDEKVTLIAPGLSAFDILTKSNPETSNFKMEEEIAVVEMKTVHSLTKAKLIEGEVRPVIDLPVFEVHPNNKVNTECKGHFLSKENVDYSKDPNLVKAKIVDGEIIPVIDLPAFEICGNC